ncbi:MAG: metalloregulator ArsR/SmtB family transcription factor [Pseudomonadota bacterium]
MLQTLLENTPLSLDQTVNLLRASGEPTRLRLLMLLAESDLTVSDLTEILGQSQPRISRHLKLLSEAGLLERYQEGAWAYFRLVDQGMGAGIITTLIAQVDVNDAQIARDKERLTAVRKRRAERAAEYFSRSASEWDVIRSLHVDEDKVETAMLKMVGPEKVDAMLDLGTGTGRILELFSDIYEKGTGIDASRDMLSVARSRLDDASLSRVQTRQGDLYILPTQATAFDLVTIHQVLHYLEDPAVAIREAAKALKDNGRLLIVDFAPHELEFLRTDHAHLRLGFSKEQMENWLHEAGLKPKKFQELSSKGGGKQAKDALTVSLWLAEK